MKIFPAFLMAAALPAGVLLSGAAEANLVTNGSFDNTSGQFVNNAGGGDDVPVGSNAISGWTISGIYDVLWIPGGGQYGELTASPGNGSQYFLDLTGTSDHAPYDGVSQTIATTANDTYRLTFDLGSATQWGIQDGLVASAGTTSALFTSTNPGNSTNFWNSETLNFTATGSSTVISFVGASGQSYIGLDNVNVVQTGVSAVPEPSTWMMMLMGFAGLGFVARQSKKKSHTALAIAR
jgi:uncharacterized protein DUF642/PEP-CTERM motif-containing protein